MTSRCYPSCSSHVHAQCQTSGCRKPATVLCKFPVTRHGRSVQCNRHICAGCASRERYCPPHSRVAPEALVKICAVCYSSSCAHGELPCDRAGQTRMVNVAQWKTLLSFGAL